MYIGLHYIHMCICKHIFLRKTSRHFIHGEERDKVYNRKKIYTSTSICIVRTLNISICIVRPLNELLHQCITYVSNAQWSSRNLLFLACVTGAGICVYRCEHFYNRPLSSLHIFELVCCTCLSIFIKFIFSAVL